MPFSRCGPGGAAPCGQPGGNQHVQVSRDRGHAGGGKVLGATSPELVKYTDSGEVAGDTSAVVAYAGLIIR